MNGLGAAAAVAGFLGAVAVAIGSTQVGKDRNHRVRVSDDAPWLVWAGWTLIVLAFALQFWDSLRAH